MSFSVLGLTDRAGLAPLNTFGNICKTLLSLWNHLGPLEAAECTAMAYRASECVSGPLGASDILWAYVCLCELIGASVTF